MMPTEVFDWWLHFGHTNNVGNSSQRSDNATESVRVFFTELFEQHNAELYKHPSAPTVLATKETYLIKQADFTTLLDHNSEPRC